MNNEAAAIHRSNAAAWNETSGWYERRANQLRETLASGASTLHKQECELLNLLPPLDSWCNLAVHLQCAAGFDTISLTNLGARHAIGVDISPELIRVGRTLAEQFDAPVALRCADVLEVCGIEGQADLVYTGKGAIHWIFDLRAWAAKVAGTLRPGGWFLLFDFHPMMWLFRDGERGLEVNPVSYFAPVIKYREWSSDHFAGPDAPTSKTGLLKQLRLWPPSAVIQSLIGAGLTLSLFHEYPDSLTEDWTAYPRATMVERARIASTYAVMAYKPDR